MASCDRNEEHWMLLTFAAAAASMKKQTNKQTTYELTLTQD